MDEKLIDPILELLNTDNNLPIDLIRKIKEHNPNFPEYKPTLMYMIAQDLCESTISETSPGNSFKISPKGRIIISHGGWLKHQQENDEKKKLEDENRKLTNDKLKYEKELQGLQKQLLWWNLAKHYWWALMIIATASVSIGVLISHPVIQFLIGLYQSTIQ